MIEIIEEHNCSICGEKLKKESFNPYPIRTLGECCKDCYEKVEQARKELSVVDILPIQVKL